MKLSGKEAIELVKAYKSGSLDAADRLMLAYKPLVKKLARAYFLAGGEPEDLIQEGMIGLFNALRSYDETAGKSFTRFAEICINRRLLSAVRASTRDKHKPLNDYISFSEPDEEAYSPTNISAEEQYFDGLTVSDRLSKINDMLTPLENEVLKEYIEGLSYLEIAVKLSKTEKTIDNALQRIKKKLIT